MIRLLALVALVAVLAHPRPAARARVSRRFATPEGLAFFRLMEYGQ